MKKCILTALLLALCVAFSVAAAAAHEHQPGPADYEKTKEPSCSEEGVCTEIIRCVQCGEELSRKELPAARTAHTPALPVKENILPATCKDQGSYDSVIRCEVCGEELQRTTKIIPRLTTHVSEYSKDRMLRRVGNDSTVVVFADPALAPITKPCGLTDAVADTFVAADHFLDLSPLRKSSADTGSRRTCADGEERCAVCGELLNPAIPHIWDAGNFHEDSPVFPWESVSYYTCLLCGQKYYFPASGCVGGAATRTYWYGDVDGDREVTAEDARLALRCCVGLEQYDKDSRAFCCADYDGNGKISPDDARAILRTAVKLQKPCSLWGTASNVRPYRFSDPQK